MYFSTNHGNNTYGGRGGTRRIGGGQVYSFHTAPAAFSIGAEQKLLQVLPRGGHPILNKVQLLVLRRGAKEWGEGEKTDLLQAPVQEIIGWDGSTLYESLIMTLERPSLLMEKYSPMVSNVVVVLRARSCTH